MNTRTNWVLVLAAALSASAFVTMSVASENTPAIAFSVRTVTSADSGFEKISIGATESAVLRVLGSPSQELSSDAWVYHNYHADLALANEQGCDTMEITFAQGRVTDMKLVNHRAVTIIAAKAQVTHGGYLALNGQPVIQGS